MRLSEGLSPPVQRRSSISVTEILQVCFSVQAPHPQLLLDFCIGQRKLEAVVPVFPSLSLHVLQLDRFPGWVESEVKTKDVHVFRQLNFS